VSETLRKVERTTAESKIAKLDERTRDLTEALDLLNNKLEATDRVSVVGHKGATSGDTLPSVH
jgi:hypothetical protein